jgi:hypothetical protein
MKDESSHGLNTEETRTRTICALVCPMSAHQFRVQSVLHPWRDCPQILEIGTYRVLGRRRKWKAANGLWGRERRKSNTYPLSRILFRSLTGTVVQAR